MKYILIKFDNTHCVILEDDKGAQYICPTKVDAVKLQAKNKDYTIVPMTDIISIIDSVKIISNKNYWYDSVRDLTDKIKDILSLFSEI